MSNEFSSSDLLLKRLVHLPHIAHVASAPYLLVIPAGSDGKPLPSALNDDDVQEVGRQGGMYFSQDRVTLVAGRVADPNRPDEMVATAEAARLSGWHLGETVPFDAYTLQQSDESGFNPSTGKPAARFSAKLVGLRRSLSFRPGRASRPSFPRYAHPANLSAVIPGRIAARTPTALVLRAEEVHVL